MKIGEAYREKFPTAKGLPKKHTGQDKRKIDQAYIYYSQRYARNL
jgi:hypothetical protein